MPRPPLTLFAVLAPLWAGLGCASDPAADKQADRTESSDDGDDGADGSSEEPTAWGAVAVDAEEQPPELLSTLQLLRWRDGAVEYNADVVPYTLNTPLFSDFAKKDRAIWMPPGTAATWSDDSVLKFPVGTAIVKTFLLSPDLRDTEAPLQIVETRLMLRGSDGWTAWPYLWRSDGSDAELHVSGKVFDHTFTDADGESRTAHYLVPQKNQCVDCHETYNDAEERALRPLGPESWLIDDGALLERLVADGLLEGAPDLGTVETAVDWAAIERDGIASLDSAQIEAAARDYLHVNCAHCHSPQGIEGITSQFFLDRASSDPFHLGVCKRPGSAGEGGEDREFDIVPGDPEASILWYRLDTEDVGAMMPDIGRSLRHDAASALIWRWIEQMPPDDCSGSD
jgi:uncharacterized repeat protein (TIGR03806 family)